MSNLETPVHNTPYSDEELEYFKNLLLEEREETVTKIENAKKSIDNQSDREDERISSQTHHPGDIGSEEEEKETDYILYERNREKLKKIDAALERIENKTYGVCEDTGKKIRKERLVTIPYTRYSAKARKKDNSGRPEPYHNT